MARGLLSRSAAPPAATSSNESFGSSRVWTPLRENHFAPPLLSSKERSYLVRKSCEAAQELVERARSAGGPISWRHVEKNNGVQIYAGSPRSTTTGSAHTPASMCGVTCVPGTLKEVASLFELSSTRQMKEFARAHREWFYDGIVLHTLAPRTKEKPLHQVTAKWMVIQMPSGLPHRDFCFLECQDKFIDAKGRKGWVLGQHSIKLPGCDELKREFGLIRGSLYHSGFVVVESEERPGHVDVIYLVQLNLKDHISIPLKLLQAKVLFVAQVRNMLRSKRLNEQRYLSDLELVPRKHRARCAVCQDSFSLLLLRKLNCRKCGEVVCAACSKEFPIENRNFAATNGRDEVRKLRICMRCFQSITNAPKPSSALAQPAHSSTMSMSLLGYCDDNQRAAYMASRAEDYRNQSDEPPPKIFLQSMRNEKSSRRRMSSTSPIPGNAADSMHSSSRHRGRRNPDAELYHRSHRYHEQQHDTERSHHRASHRVRPSEFRPSQSLSLDDPFSNEEGRYTLQMPGPPAVAPPASIFDRPSNAAIRRTHNDLFRCNSSDMLVGSSSRNMSNFSRLQELSSRERLMKLQRENNMSRSSYDLRIPDSYMSTSQHGSREKREFQLPSPIYNAPPSDFGAFNATLDDRPIVPPDFSTFDQTHDLDGPPPLDMTALTSCASAIPIELNKMDRSAMSRDREQELLHLLERKVERHRESTSSDSSACSIDIDSCDEPVNFFKIPPIPEQTKQRREQSYEEGIEDIMPEKDAGVPKSITSRENLKQSTIHEAAEDSEGSMGASDEEVESWASDTLTTSPRLRQIDANAEEKKTPGFAETLKFPFPSTHKATQPMLERPGIAKTSADTMLRDVASAEIVMSDHVETFTNSGSEEDFICHDRQRRESKVEDLIDYEIRQASGAQDSLDEECYDGDEATVDTKESSMHDQTSEGLAAVDYEIQHLELDSTGGNDMTTAFDKTNNADVRLETLPDGDSSKMSVSGSNSRQNLSHENVISLDRTERKEHQTSSRTGDSFAQGASFGFTNGDDVGDDFVAEEVKHHTGSVKDKVKHGYSTPIAPSKVESAMLSADSETIQTSGYDISESQLIASGRVSDASLPRSNSTSGSSVCSMGLDQITPPATPTAASFANNASPAYSPDPFDMTEQPQEMQQNVPTQELQVETQSQSSVDVAAPNNVHPSCSSSVNAQEQKSLSDNAGGVVGGLYPSLQRDESNYARNSID
ncbi:hypothetical protein PsorP6_011904 [Peronosclerospora sorghi]|uniref:Uncharacterized protein n=1 Tax=Peronosclerospora sorghi TaxID=230839 RepID=A0ACC0WHP9_9STRA|nr:hypothetical protein PsorP6_011904 [Peronosclerospora sorghi]